MQNLVGSKMKKKKNNRKITLWEFKTSFKHDNIHKFCALLLLV